MQYPERRHSRLETFKLDNVHILVYLLHRRPFAYHLYSVIHTATPDAIKPFLISYFILAFGSDDDSYICIFILC